MNIRFCLLLIFLSTSCVGNRAEAQAPADSNLVEKYLLDFVVPDMPAFKALGTDPSNILRPSDVKKFAAMFTPFYSNKAGVIPKNFALEFAPWKFRSRKWTLDDYTTSHVKRFAYRSSFSIGTVNDTSKYSSKLAIGYRISLLSRRADILRSAKIRNEVLEGTGIRALPAVQVAFQALTDFWVINVLNIQGNANRISYYSNHKKDFHKFLLDIENQFTNYAGLEAAYGGFINAYNGGRSTKLTDEELKDLVQAFGARVDGFIEEYKKDNWNAGRFDLAVAFVAQSPDTLITNAQFSKFSFWATWALPVHRGGQLLLGGNLILPRVEKARSSDGESKPERVNYNLNIRYYIGSEDVRGFFETQYKYATVLPTKKSLLLNLGAEFRLGRSFWVLAGAGLDNYLDEERPFKQFVSSLDLRYFFNQR